MALGQQDFPLVKEGGIWRIGYSSLDAFSKEQMLMQGDTLFDNKVFKKVYHCDYSPSIINKVFFGGMREDSMGRVYFFMAPNQFIFPNFQIQSNVEYLVYDFSLSVGDTLKVANDQDSLQVLVSIDTVLVSSQYRKKYTYSGLNGSPSREVIEGIGSAKGLFFTLQYEFEHLQLLTCYEDTSIFWNNPMLQGIDCFSVGIGDKLAIDDEKLNLYPNPAQNKLTLQMPEVFANEEVHLSVYDLHGRNPVNINLTTTAEHQTIDVSKLNPGFYLGIITTPDGQLRNFKFVKE